jgi:hypothetical protein
MIGKIGVDSNMHSTLLDSSSMLLFNQKVHGLGLFKNLYDQVR